MSDVLTVLFATTTGNAEMCATDAATRAAEEGFEVRTLNMTDTMPADLAGDPRVLVVVSTWGEGEPPDDAIPFWEALEQAGPGLFTGTRFAVFALGDSSYEDFCGFGRKCDRRFGELGAVRAFPIKECDVDFEDPLKEWLGEIFPAIRDAGGVAA